MGRRDLFVRVGMTPGIKSKISVLAIFANIRLPSYSLAELFFGQKGLPRLPAGIHLSSLYLKRHDGLSAWTTGATL